MDVIDTLRTVVRTITHPLRINACSTTIPSWLLATSSIFNKVLLMSANKECQTITGVEVMPDILDARLFRICVDVYKGKTDFSSLASLVSKLSSIAGQVSIHRVNVWSSGRTYHPFGNLTRFVEILLELA